MRPFLRCQRHEGAEALYASSSDDDKGLRTLGVEHSQYVTLARSTDEEQRTSRRRARTLVVGIVGIVSRLRRVGSPAPPTTDARRAIYYTGYGEDGQIPRSMPGGRAEAPDDDGAACVDCHQEDGRGGRLTMMMGRSIEVPTFGIRHSRAARREWRNRAGLDRLRDRRAIRQDGAKRRAASRAHAAWDMTDAEVDAVITY